MTEDKKLDILHTEEVEGEILHTEARELEILRTEEGEFETTLNRMYKNRIKWKPENPKHIVAFMPGTVEKIKVKKGRRVTKGQSLVIFRAMKMSNNILAPMDGKIKKVNAAVGDNVPKDGVILEFE